MKRYIQIVYDNSGSMNEYVGGKKKYEIAQDLFEKEILPSIANKGDEVVLRLLCSDCQSNTSKYESLTTQFSYDRKAMLDRIRGIDHDQSTPLFYTVKDAIVSCQSTNAQEYLIFVLTDGDDTCGSKITDIITKHDLSVYIKAYQIKFLLVQLAIESPISRNNLTALTNYVGGTTINIDQSDSTSVRRSKLKKALLTTGFTTKGHLPHCFEEVDGNSISWDEIESRGIKFHSACLLYEYEVLSWSPKYASQVSPIEFAELHFVNGLFFNSGISIENAKAMLKQLKKPYYYSYDCIYWDFSDAKWKYFKQQNEVSQLDNPKAQFDDEINSLENNIEISSRFDTSKDIEEGVYLVKLANTIAPRLELVFLGNTDYTITAVPGDQIRFKFKK